VMGKNPSLFKGRQKPVVDVSWNDAVAFCEKLSEVAEEKAAGRFYRLPTEAEWEYACRAGTTTEYSFGDSESQLGEYAWYNKNSEGKVQPVGLKQPNAWGFYDMHGNVFEWCADWYSDFSSGSVTDPAGPPVGSNRIARGGTCDYGAAHCRSAYRYAYAPSDRSNTNVCFRVAMISDDIK